MKPGWSKAGFGSVRDGTGNAFLKRFEVQLKL